MKSVLTSLLVAALLTSCSKENAYQDDANQQNNLASQQKTQQLNQAKGYYRGKMHLAQGDLDVEIYLFVSHSNASQPDQINKVQVPALSGYLRFTAIKCPAPAMSSFAELEQAMGGCQISFKNGDFNSNNSMITLPYSSDNSASTDDQVFGTFQNGAFSGEWDHFGTMGTFNNLERSDS